MCQKSKCNKCKNCPTLSWQQKARLEDLKLELDTLCDQIKLCKQQDVVDQNTLSELQQRLVDTHKYAERVGLRYTLDEL